MPLSVKDGIKTWIDDFKKSDNPKFDGKSAEKRRDMAIAAYMSAKNESVQEALLPTKDVEKVIGKGAKPIKNVKNSDGTKTEPMSRAKQLAKKARDAQPVDEMGNIEFQRQKDLAAKRKERERAAQVKSPSVDSYLKRKNPKPTGYGPKRGPMTPPKKDPNSPEFQAAKRSAERLDAIRRKGFGPSESTNLGEAHAYSKAAAALRDYANKHGGMDKKDFHTAAKHLDNVGKAGLMQKGQHLAKMNNHFRGLDTDVRDRIHLTLKQHGVMESVQEMFKSYSSMPGKRQIGRASDEPNYIPKYTALGNKRSKAAYKGTKLEKPTKQDEETQIDELKKSTLGSYVKKAAQDAAAKAYSAAQKAMSNPDQSGKDYVKSVKRQKGIAKATDRLTREAKLDELSQATMQRAADKRLSNMKAADKKYDSLKKKLDKDRYSNQMHHKLSPEKQKSTQAAADKAADDYNKNYIGTNKDFGDGGKRAAAYAKRGITPKAKGSRKAVGTNEAKLDELSRGLRQRAMDKRVDQAKKIRDRHRDEYFKSRAAASQIKTAGNMGKSDRGIDYEGPRQKERDAEKYLDRHMDKIRKYQKSLAKDEAKLDEVSAKKLTNYIGLSKDEKGNIQKTGAAGSLEKSLKKSADAFRSGDKEARRAATKTANKRAKGLQMARAKLDKKVGAGSRAKVPATEAKSFDQKFRDHLKFFTSKSPAVQAYLQKRRDARAADHAKQDPKAVKQNYGPSVLVPGRAYNAATKRGMSPRDAADAVSTTFKNRRKRKNGKLPG